MEVRSQQLPGPKSSKPIANARARFTNLPTSSRLPPRRIARRSPRRRGSTTASGSTKSAATSNSIGCRRKVRSPPNPWSWRTLFVPLKLQPEGEDEDVVPVGEFLTENPRFSILAKPGGGKSTLLKRLAVAYADPERRLASQDNLPERDWLPLFVRCRDLRERAGEPIRELLCDLGRQAEMNDDLADAFREQVDDALNAGRALLLVDGPR